MNPPIPAAWQNYPLPQPDPEPENSATREFLDHQPRFRDGLPSVWEFPDNDDGNAAFALQHIKAQIAYAPESKGWLIYFKGRWHRDTTGRLGHYCQILSRQQIAAADAFKKKLAATLADQIVDEEETSGGTTKFTPGAVKLAARIARRRAEDIGNEKTISALLAAASRNGSLVIPAADWDADPWVIGLKNGVLDLRSRSHRQGQPQDYITRSMNTEFIPGATCPEWLKFIARIMPDPELADYLQTILGYALTGQTSDQAFYFFFGDGMNGKSILIQVMAYLMGEYGGKARSNLIEESRMGADPKNDIAQLPGIRFLFGEETKQGARLREEVVKSLVAGDVMTGEPKYCSPFSFTPVAKLFVMGNHRPRICGTDGGIWRRVRLIPFTQTITPEEAVPPQELLERFKAESPGILNWLLDGLARWSTGMISMPKSVEDAVREYRQSEDDLGEFLEECTQDAEAGYKTRKLEIYQGYCRWAQENGVRMVLTQKQLTRELNGRDGWKMDLRRESWLGKSLIN